MHSPTPFLVVPAPPRYTDFDMDARSLRVLEYPALLNILAGHAASSLGSEKALALVPSMDRRNVERALQETSEARTLLDLPGGIPLGGVHDIRSLVARAAAGGFLAPEDLLTASSTLNATRRLRQLLVNKGDVAPLLQDLGNQMFEFPRYVTEVERSLSHDGEVLDSASTELSQIRNAKRRQVRLIQDILQRMISSGRTRELLQEPVITIRNGRYCLPVKPENRREFGGLVHDQSASGQTLFMEPQAVVEAGNELRQLELREEAEVERILGALSGLLGSEDRRIQATVNVLEHLDLVTARARFSTVLNGVAPLLLDTAAIDVYEARHPLLLWQAIEAVRAGPHNTPPPSEAIVPVDLRIGTDFHTLVITGPNTGGKTVTLKTAGLFALMCQIGLHLPCVEAKMGVFSGIFADIGDEQSLQQSLSTFSGHIKSIVAILKHARKGSLVLLDEIGAGTDPAEGAALAKAILLSLAERQALTIATTHYAELKEFAWDRGGFQNSSVEFDVESLRPTYRLRIGVPGASNALTISGRLGMPPEVLETARENLGTDRLALEDAISRMEETERRARRAAMDAERRARDLEAQKRHAEQELSEAKDKRREQTERAYEEALQILRSAREEADTLLKSLREQEREGRETEDARVRLQRLEEGLRQMRPKPRRKPTHRISTDALPEPGDTVWVPGLGGTGQLVEIRRDEAIVQAGTLRLTVPYSTLQKVDGEPVTTAPTKPIRETRDVGLQAATEVATEVHLRAMRADEALVKLDQYLDEARMAGLTTIRIVHGKGTGALRELVHRYLREQKDVLRFRLGQDGEGGHGVTIAELK